MPPKKSVFRQPGTKHFQLVHRSQRDPLIHDPDASQHVLKSVERGNLRKGKSRADLEGSDVEHDQTKDVGEAALYGIYYDDTDYDYMQHLRAVGVQEDGVDSILIEAPTRKDNKNKTTSDSLVIPKEVLPSTSELPRNYESQQAIPQSIAGLQPDMDPHLRQVLEALEDDAFVDDDLGENFFGELVEGGERESDDDVQFEFEEYGTEDQIDDNSSQGGNVENESAGLNWEEKFALFKQNHEGRSQESASDDESAFEENDTIASLPSISVIGGKGKRRRIGSDASGYSMSSSSMYRNQALQTLDERFDQLMGKQYHEEDEESSPSDEDDETPELITSREDFSTMVDEFLHDYEILGNKMKLKLEGNSGAEKLETLRYALSQGDRVHVNAYENAEAQDLEDIETSEKGDRWDCETILTTYSNLENHPRIIRVSPSKAVSKISLDSRTGFPLTRELTSRTTFVTKIETGNKSEDSQEAVQKRNTISRPRNESKEDKKTRKSAAKTEKQARRAEKSATQEQFDAELKHQKKTLVTSVQRTRKL